MLHLLAQGQAVPIPVAPDATWSPYTVCLVLAFAATLVYLLIQTSRNTAKTEEQSKTADRLASGLHATQAAVTQVAASVPPATTAAVTPIVPATPPVATIDPQVVELIADAVVARFRPKQPLPPAPPRVQT